MAAVPFPTSKIWNQDIDASQYRTRWPREIANALDPPIDAGGLDWGFVPRWSPIEAAPFLGSLRSGQIATRIVGVSGPPLFHQRLELGVVAIR
jgi:hypothetical protein